MKKSLQGFFILALTCSAFTLFAQHTRVHMRELEHDLPDPYVRGVFIDSIGLLWMGTLSGVYTYDGVSFQKFIHPETTLHYVNDLVSFHEYIIVHNARSLQIINTATRQVVYNSDVNHSFDQLFINSSQTKAYFLLETTEKNPVFFSIDDQGSIQQENLPPHRHRITRIVADDADGFYFIDAAGQFYFHNDSLGSQLIDNQTFINLSLLNFPKLTITKENEVHLMIDLLNTIKHYTVTPNRMELLKDNLLPNYLLHGVRNNHAMLYDEVENSLHYYNLSAKRVEEIFQLPNHVLRTFRVHEDNQGNTWIPYEAISGSGLMIAINNKSSFKSLQYHHDDGSVIPVRIRSINNDFKDGIITCGLDGIYKADQLLSELKILSYPTKETEAEGFYQIIRDEEHQSFWISRTYHGIYKLSADHEFIEGPYLNSAVVKNSFSLYLDDNDILWVSSINDIGWYDTKTKTMLISEAFQPSFNNVRGYDWVKTDSNDIWLCSSNGLFLFDGDRKIKKWLHQKSIPPLSSNEVYGIEKIGNQHFIATNNGLNVLKDDTILVYGVDQGFASNVIASTLCSKDDLWIGTYTGLTRLNLTTQNVQNFYIEDGLPSNEFNRTARYKDKDGRFYFGTQNGIVHFHPDSFRSQHSSANLVIKSFSRYDIDGETVSFDQGEIAKSKEIIIPAGNKYFQMQVALLQLTNSSQNKYAYFLEGFENDWSVLTNLNTIQYNNLPAGEYTIRVKAMDHTGVWAANQLSIPIIVKQHFYKSLWFILSLVAFVIGAIGYWYRSRALTKLKMERLRTKLSTDLHDDVGGLIAGVSMQLELLERRSKPENKSVIQHLTNVNKQIMGRMRDLMWAIDARSDHWHALRDQMRNHLALQLTPLDIHFELIADLDEQPQKITTEVKQHLYLIFKEAVTNSIKYAKANKVTVSLWQRKNKFRLHIEDDGIGFSDSDNFGNGLKNMEFRASEINAHLTRSSSNGAIIKLERL